MKYEYNVARNTGCDIANFKRMIDFGTTPILYVRRYKENLVIITESEYKRLKGIEKEMERIDTCLKLATGSSVSCFSYKDKNIACMSVEKYNDLLSKALQNKENE